MSTSEGDQVVDTGANWLIDAVVAEGDVSGNPLTPDEVAILSTSTPALTEDQRPMVVALNNKVVTLARSAMIRGKESGAESISPRRGLRIPKDWYEQYSKMYSLNIDWTISGMMQNAMLNNPMAGERKNWKSK